MTHKAETVIQALCRIYGRNNTTGAITKKLNRITKKLYSKAIPACNLTDIQRQDVEAFAIQEVIALGNKNVDGTVPTPSENNPIELREQIKTGRGGRGQTRERSNNYVKGTHVARGVSYGRIKLSSGALLSLEPVVITAIKFLDPKMSDKGAIKTSEWCDKAVKNWSGEMLNNAAIIRCSVITELLARVQPC